MSEFLEKYYDEIFLKYDEKVLLRDVDSYKNGKGNLYKVLGHFFKEEQFKCMGARGQMTPMEALENDEVMEKIVAFTKTKPNFYKKTEALNVQDFFRNAGRTASKVAQFPIKEATKVYETYSNVGDLIYDPSCGFGSRMCATILNGRTYIGTDPNQSLVVKLNECGKFLQEHCGAEDFEIKATGSEIYHDDLNGRIDLAFTSPPYYDYEKYGKDEGQSIVKYPTYEEWLDEFSTQTLINCGKYAKVGGIIAINLKNMRNRGNLPLYDDWKNILDNINGLKFKEEMDMKYSKFLKRDYKGKHWTGGEKHENSNFGQREPIMVYEKEKENVVYKREESKEKEMSEVENDFSQNPERQTGMEEKKEVVPEKGKLEATFGVPPFSILNTNQGYWKDRKKEWNSIGIESEVGRDARSYNIKEWVEEKGKSGGGSSQQERVLSDVSIFDPVLTELNYKWFCPPNGTILDPFAGGSVRGIVASALGYEYTGVDLRQEQVDANYENIDKLSIKLPIDPVWLQGDSTDIQNVGGEYDMIFSCPPYFDLEEYSKDPKDLSNMTYENFVKQYSLIIKNAVSMLKDNSFAVFVVGEIRDEDGFNRNFVGDTINAFMEAGMKFYNEGILYTSINTMSMRVSAQFTPYRKLGKVHQNVLVFYKAHSRKGTQRIFRLPECKFTPIKEMNIEPRERLKIITTRSLDNIETKMRTKDIPCDICGYVSPTKEDYDTHLTGKWHMRAVERS